jgi:CRISPR-associated protein Csb3
MAEASIPVDLRNPGQVFACLGLMEAAEILIGPCEGRFAYTGGETLTRFEITAPGEADPVAAAISFLCEAEVVALAPPGATADLSTVKWKVLTEPAPTFAGHEPDSPATLPIRLRAGGREIAVEHWLDSDRLPTDAGRDNVKFWAGAAGYPGAALARDALACLSALGANARAEAAHDPFAVEAPMSSSFRFDWRRDYIPLDAGFSPNLQGSVTMVGFPLVELFAAIGLQNARPARINRRDKLAYRYGVSNARLPTVFARAVLGGEGLGFLSPEPTLGRTLRTFRMQLGWPGQEGQARCIIDAQEELG